MRKLAVSMFLSLLGIAFLSACGGTGNGGDGPDEGLRDEEETTIEGTAQNYGGPTDQLEAYLYTNTSHLIATGSISTAGSFSIVLPDAVPPEQLDTITDEFPPGPFISDINAEIGVVELGLTSGGVPSGYLALTSYADPGDANTVGARRTHYVYLDRNVTVTGTSTLDDSVYVLDFDKGWNLISVEHVDLPDGTPRKFTTGSASGVAWHYFSLTP